MKTNLNIFSTILICILCLQGCFAAKFKCKPVTPQSNNSNIYALSGLTVLIDIESAERQKEVLKDLRNAGIFKEVFTPDNNSKHSTPPDLVLIKDIKTCDKRGDSSCSLGYFGEMFTIYSFGLLPQICENECHEKYVLLSPLRGKTVEISVNYEAGTVLGLAAIFYSLSPDWTMNIKDPD